MNFGLYGFPVKQYASASNQSYIDSTYGSHRLIHFDMSDYNGSLIPCKKNPGTVTLPIGGATYDSTDKAYVYSGSSGSGSTSSGGNQGNFGCTNPLYFLVYKYTAVGQVVTKNASRTTGNSPPGRFMQVQATGNLRNGDSDPLISLPSGSISTGAWHLFCYGRMADNAGVQQRRHFFDNLDTTIYSQSTVSYTAVNDEYMVGAAFSGYLERMTGSIREVLIYKTDGFTDAQRNELIDSKFIELKNKWGI